MEKESKAKNEKIQQLQEKNLQAVVQTPGESVPCQNKSYTSNVLKMLKLLTKMGLWVLMLQTLYLKRYIWIVTKPLKFISEDPA